ncbi:MAG: hypothetical protein LLG08_07565 [Actinomycetia bacterium]|nr:hypothetical protein [Actinomycetes bacterium]
MSRLRVRAVSVALLLVVSIVCVPALAFAGVSEYQVQFAPAGVSGMMDLIVNVVLSPDTKLPATVHVPLPAGATILWSGEILGGDPANDPSREATLTTVGGAQYAELTLKQVRIAQVEAEVGAPSISGDNVKARLDWINTTDAGTYTFSVRIEPKVSGLKIVPQPVGAPQANAEGESLYTLAPVRLEKGGTFAVDVSYRRGADATGVPAGGSSPVLIVAVTFLVIAVAALVVVVVRQRQSGGPRPATGPTARAASDTSRTSGEPTAPPDGESASAEDDETFTWD